MTESLGEKLTEDEIMDLINGMEAAGYNPYSIEEDTACDYIDAVNHRGFKLVILPNGKEFKAYSQIKRGV